MLSIPCFNILRIPKLILALEENGYEAEAGFQRVRLSTKTNPPTQLELRQLEQIIGRALQDEPKVPIDGELVKGEVVK